MVNISRNFGLLIVEFLVTMGLLKFEMSYIVRLALTQDLGDKQKREGYCFIVLYLCVKLSRGQLSWFGFCQLVTS